MAREGSRRAGCSRQAGARGGGRRRPPTWEVSDSDGEGPAGAEARARARGPAEERRAATEERRAAAEALRPEQALRRVAVRVDPALLEDARASILLEALGALGCEYHLEPQRPARSLRWTRAKPDPCPCTVPSEVWGADEQDLLLLLEPEEFLRGIVQLTQTCGLSCSVPWICPESSTSAHLAVIGLDAYLWSPQPSSQERRQRESPAMAHAPMALSWPQVEEALVLLQLWAHVDVLLVDSWQELSQHVCAFTKALAQRPFKRYRESRAFSFCVDGRWAAGEHVAKDGTGLRGVWWRQIRQFHRVSPAMADAIVTAFPSPRLLQQAYTSCSTEQERLALLADLPVKTGDGVRPRRVGPDLSRRICLFLTATNPELLLDLGS
ncbi:probable crossover junction endonuclease EME2 [Ursus maritimus]|uniref:Structure-specific endonuclease subunit EME2 n=1 Tax=Ursus maritimus TaxID=29073 RepID=A0A8M1GEI7_URSMA|nr:probable crossover junction endonuclease EME2 isoform X2 [Ursus arctos]XP_040490389.1 probable crossover junction endonuclease EME2 [Ursus maritimus]